ncbi:MAG: alpha/beta fold hydrolase, partial [Acidobacteria bacterium]|nr:alpha/beta fold hydrolase [Acidobacteriota bacterium]
GFMEWSFFPPLAELLAARGFGVVRFNFSGSGMRPGEELATDLEGFRGNTFTADRDDVLAVLEAVSGGQLAPERLDPARLGLLGHSRGGGAALLAAASEGWRERIGALVTWASISTYDRFSAEQKAAWRRRGETLVVNGRTGQELPMGTAALDDLEANAKGLDLLAAAGRRRAPWLIVHGTDDETVPVAEAHRLVEVPVPAGVDPAELRVVEGGGHTFGSRHPFAGPRGPLTAAMNHTQRWFRAHLG